MTRRRTPPGDGLRTGKTSADRISRAPLWSTALRKRPGADTYAVRPSHISDVLATLQQAGLAEVSLIPLFDATTRAWPVLNGAVVEVEGYGFGQPRRTVRIYGQQAMQWLTDRLGLRRPRAGRPELTSEHLARLVEVQAGLPHDAQVQWTRQTMTNSTEEMREGAAYLGPTPPRHPALGLLASTPARYYVTPTMTVDRVGGLDLPAEDAAGLIAAGLHIEGRTEQCARAALHALNPGMSRADIDSTIRFGQTGQV